MSATGIVQIVGAPINCKEGLKDAWREVAKKVARQLDARFGQAVSVHYFDLFDEDCPDLPANAQLPMVLINGEVLKMGGKISVPDIRRKLEEIGIQADNS